MSWISLQFNGMKDDFYYNNTTLWEVGNVHFDLSVAVAVTTRTILLLLYDLVVWVNASLSLSHSLALSRKWERHLLVIIKCHQGPHYVGHTFCLLAQDSQSSHWHFGIANCDISHLWIFFFLGKKFLCLYCNLQRNFHAKHTQKSDKYCVVHICKKKKMYNIFHFYKYI